MNKKEGLAILGILVILALAAPLPATAQERGVYVGASLGTGEFRHTCTLYSGRCDPEDTGYRLFGGYRSSPNMAIELGYGSIAETQVNGTQIATGATAVWEGTLKAFDVSILPTLPLSDRLAIFGRLGIYRAQLEARGTIGAPFDLSDHGSGWTFGAGLRFDVARAFAVRAEWQRYDSVGGGAVGQVDVDYLNLGLELRF